MAGSAGAAGSDAGEVLAAENALANANDGDMFGVCNTPALAQDFVPTVGGKLTRLRTRVTKYLAPTDSAYMEIWQGGAIPEAGTLLATSAPVPPASVSTVNPVLSDVDFFFDQSTAPILAAGTKYFFVARKTGSLDCLETTTYRVGFGSNTYASGRCWVKFQSEDPSAWSIHDKSGYDYVFEAWVTPL